MILVAVGCRRCTLGLGATRGDGVKESRKCRKRRRRASSPAHTHIVSWLSRLAELWFRQHVQVASLSFEFNRRRLHMPQATQYVVHPYSGLGVVHASREVSGHRPSSRHIVHCGACQAKGRDHHTQHVAGAAVLRYLSVLLVGPMGVFQRHAMVGW